MVVLNDVGLFFEIVGFVIFLAIPIQRVAGGFLRLNSAPEDKGLKSFIDNHPRFENALRGFGVTFIVAGLIMQFTFFNQPPP